MSKKFTKKNIKIKKPFSDGSNPTTNPKKPPIHPSKTNK